MRVITVKKPRPTKHSHHSGRWLVFLLLVVLAAGSANYFRPLPLVQPHLVADKSYPATPISLDWPGYGQAALATGGKVLATAGAQTPLATASIAKVITALCILEKYPLATNQDGPTLTLTAADVAIHDTYLSKDGSVVEVQAGEQLTEREVLEAMMLPSANNMADSGAIWAYGSLSSYITYANTFLASHGLTNTHVDIDASGFDGATTSTASDLAQLGSLALAQPALVAITKEPSAMLPVAGTVYNYNGALGQQGIFGLKTGNNDQDTGAFLFAAKLPVGAKEITVTGAVMGASSLRGALTDSVALLASAGKNFTLQTVATANQSVASYTAPWGATAHAVASSQLQLFRWNSDVLRTNTTASAIKAGDNPHSVGTLKVNSPSAHQSVDLQLDHPVANPSFWWRLTRH